MQYLLMIYEDEKISQGMSPAEQGAFFNEYMTFSKEVAASGAMKGGDALEPVAKAVTVRVREGKTLRTDGPFAETKEQLGGYYLIEAKTLDEAVAIAAKIPSARHGSIEVRPVMVFEGQPG